MIVGHLALAALAKRTFFKAERLPVLIFASYGPDLVDKTGSLLFGYPGRHVGHSLVLFLAVLAVAWTMSHVLRFRQDAVLATALMWVAHLAGDFVLPTVLLWPFLGPIAGEPFDASGALHRMYVELRWPGQLFLEICLVTLALLPLHLLEKIGSTSAVRVLKSLYTRKVPLKNTPQVPWTEIERK
jgi:hypothetical protein